MSIEEQIRQKQRFEEKLEDFLRLAASLTDQDLEIALARLADLLTKADPQSATAFRFKGIVLHIYYNMRMAGIKRYSTLTRMRHNIRAGIYIGDFGEHLISQVSWYSFPEIPAYLNAEYQNEDFVGQKVRLLAP